MFLDELTPIFKEPLSTQSPSQGFPRLNLADEPVKSGLINRSVPTTYTSTTQDHNGKTSGPQSSID